MDRIVWRQRAVELGFGVRGEVLADRKSARRPELLRRRLRFRPGLLRIGGGSGSSKRSSMPAGVRTRPLAFPAPPVSARVAAEQRTVGRGVLPLVVRMPVDYACRVRLQEPQVLSRRRGC